MNSVRQINKGFHFESETDTEVIAKLIKHLHDTLPSLSFRELVEQVILQLVRKKKLLSLRVSESYDCDPNSIPYIPHILSNNRREPLLLPSRVQSIPDNLWPQEEEVLF